MPLILAIAVGAVATFQAGAPGFGALVAAASTVGLVRLVACRLRVASQQVTVRNFWRTRTIEGAGITRVRREGVGQPRAVAATWDRLVLELDDGSDLGVLASTARDMDDLAWQLALVLDRPDLAP